MSDTICKVCNPTAKTPCQLAATMCPYRDIDTKKNERPSMRQIWM